MAKIGMEYVVSALFTDGSDASPAYTEGKAWGPASSFNITPNANDVTDYGDDHMVESDKSINNVSVSVELNENTLELEASLLGHNYSKEKKEMTATRDDVAPYIGMGCIGKSMRNNKVVYRGIWLFKAKLSEPSDENTTKQESTTFNHSNYEGTAYAIGDAKGSYAKKAEFDTLDEAKTWINKIAGISES